MHDFCFTIPYGIVIVCGGLVGYLRKGSVDSLAGGIGSGALLLVAGQLSLSAYHRGSNSWLALLLQTAVSMALTWFMGQRYQSTGKFMPAGTVAGISAVMSLFYLYKLLSGGNHIPKKNPASASTGKRAD